MYHSNYTLKLNILVISLIVHSFIHLFILLYFSIVSVNFNILRFVQIHFQRLEGVLEGLLIKAVYVKFNL